MNYIYELQHDTDGIERMQYASTHNPFGLKITHGLIHTVIHKSFGIANSHAKQRLASLHIVHQLYLRFS